jgi:endonuclease YncB( thermonuclease family)
MPTIDFNDFYKEPEPEPNSFRNLLLTLAIIAIFITMMSYLGKCQDTMEVICVQVISGDSLRVRNNPNEFTIHLKGIQAPDKQEFYYTESKEALYFKAMLRQLYLVIYPNGYAQAFLKQSGEDLAWYQLANGYAKVDPMTKNLRIDYLYFQRCAYKFDKGMWNQQNRINFYKNRKP